MYPQHATLDLIKIQNVASEQRVRGQVKDSHDWVSLKNTNDGFMWMQPMSEVKHKHKASNQVPKFQNKN